MAINNSISARYNSLRAFIVPLIQSEVGITCIIGGQNAPRPSLPYASLMLFDAINEIGTVERRMDGNGQEYLMSTLEIEVDVHIYTDSDSRMDNAEIIAYSYLEILKTKLSLPASQAALNEEGLAYIDGGLISSQSVILNTTFEPRAICTLRFRTSVMDTYDTGAIEIVSPEGTYDTLTKEMTASSPVDITNP